MTDSQLLELQSNSPGASATAAASFADFNAGIRIQIGLRAAIACSYRRPESDCVEPLLALATLAEDASSRVSDLARDLVLRLRRKTRSGGVEGLIHEYSLSSQEGVALMCLAEALLRIPDSATRDDLIRDKISTGDWRAHIGSSSSLFVNAATWGLVVTGKLIATANETNLSSALTRLVARGGEPIIRKGVNLAMRLMGEQFVTGQTIDEALSNGRRMEARGFRHSYDMWEKRRSRPPMRPAIFPNTRPRSMRSERALERAASTRDPVSPSSYQRFILAIAAARSIA